MKEYISHFDNHVEINDDFKEAVYAEKCQLNYSRLTTYWTKGTCGTFVKDTGVTSDEKQINLCHFSFLKVDGVTLVEQLLAAIKCSELLVSLFLLQEQVSFLIDGFVEGWVESLPPFALQQKAQMVDYLVDDKGRKIAKTDQDLQAEMEVLKYNAVLALQQRANSKS